MPAPITEVTIKPAPDKLRLEWGLPVEDGSWVWDQPHLEVRLYCRPFPDFGKPTLLDMDLDGTEITHTSGGMFKLPFVDITVGKDKSRSAFRPGTVTADPTGKYYPLHFDLHDAHIPPDGVICHPAVEWPVDGNWLEQPFACWVVFGYTARGEFIPVNQEPPYEHRPEGKAADERLPDDVPTVPREQRVQRRAESPKLFISYSHNDLFPVNSITKRLNDEFYYDVWIDYESIPGGSKWREEIASAIQEADQVLFMMTSSACASRWCKIEVEYALKHGKTVIPLRLTGDMDEDDLAQVGLKGRQWIDFAKLNEDAAWQHLLDSLPVVTNRDRYWLEHPDAQRLHERYLRRFFKDKFMKISLADMLDDPPERGVELLDVYVPLPVDMSVTVQVSEDDRYTITDWWVKTERSETPADTATPEELRGQRLCEWPALRVGQDRLQLLIDDVQHQIKENRDDQDSRFRSEQNWHMEAHDAAAIQPRMVLTGNPGSGKSTFLKHLAICMAGDQLRHSRHAKADLDTLEFWPLPAYTPVFISLRDLVSKQFADTHDPAGTAQFEAYVQAQLEAENLGKYWPHLQRQLEDGEAIILLDGLDEVPDAVTKERREQIIRLVDALNVDYEHCRMIVTSRPYAYNGDWQLDGFGQTALVPLFPHRVQQLVEKLFGQALPEDQVEDEVEGFLRSLDRIDDPNLSNTPLLFTMMAALWLRNTDTPPDERLPQRLSQLYRENVDLMLRRWTRKDEVDGQSIADHLQLSPEQLRQALMWTAYHVQAERGSDREATFRQGILIEAMEVARGDRVEKYGDALDYLEQRAGLLTSEEARRYRFTHLSFQEHLAACYLAHPDRFPADIVRHIQAQPGRWRNVIPLLADEVGARGGNLLRLVEPLVAADPADDWPRDHPQWEMVGHAGMILDDYDLALSQSVQSRLKTWLAAALERGAASPTDRAAMGRTLAELGDSRPGVGLRDDGLPDLDWVEIPEGEFIYQDGERLTLPTFYVSRYPITYRQFQAFIDADDGFYNPEWREGLAAGDKHKSSPDKQRFKYWNHPRECVSWWDAIAFCRWLSSKLGYEVTLPTEQQFEKAARGTDGLEYPYGNKFDANKGNTSETGIKQTSAVGIFPDGASPYGVLDLSGNVWCWCLNEYDNPENTGLGGGAARVLRGGSWYPFRFSARSVFPRHRLPSSRYYDYGFWCVCASPMT